VPVPPGISLRRDGLEAERLACGRQFWDQGEETGQGSPRGSHSRGGVQGQRPGSALTRFGGGCGRLGRPEDGLERKSDLSLKEDRGNFAPG